MPIITTTQWNEALLNKCYHTRPSPTSATLYCLSLSVSFVASLYLVVPASIQKLNRDDPRQIKWRTFSVALVCVFAISSYPFLFCSFENKSSSSASSILQIMGWSCDFHSIISVLFHTTLLYLGPIAEEVYDEFNFRHLTTWLRDGFSSLASNDSKRWQQIRNFVTAPIAEEIVFRGCMVPVLLASGVPELRVICFGPFFFGVAHVHHAMQRRKLGVPWKHVLIGSLFQFAYTSLFGSYVAFVLIRTGSIVSAIVCHSYCNYMGLPGFYFLRRNGSGRLFFGVVYLVGMILFVVGFRWVDSADSLSDIIRKSLV